MIVYNCKYTPIELLRAYGGQPVLLDGEEKDFELAESLTHANFCCHAKALIQQGTRTEELALMDCCDSLRRSYDVLRWQNDQSFLRLVDLPHEGGTCARERFKGELIRLGEAYGAYRGTAFNRDAFLAACRESVRPLSEGPFLAVLGARASPPLPELIQREMPLPVVNLTCSGSRGLEAPPEGAEEMDFDALMAWYSRALLGMIPCMRMASVAGRRALTCRPRLRGVIYNTVKFCDFYSFDYAALRRESDLPVLKIESDYMPQPAGQLAARLEAFAESLFPDAPDRREKSMETGGLYAGIDSGSIRLPF